MVVVKSGTSMINELFLMRWSFICPTIKCKLFRFRNRRLLSMVISCCPGLGVKVIKDGISNFTSNYRSRTIRRKKKEKINHSEMAINQIFLRAVDPHHWILMNSISCSFLKADESGIRLLFAPWPIAQVNLSLMLMRFLLSKFFFLSIVITCEGKRVKWNRNGRRKKSLNFTLILINYSLKSMRSLP